MRGSIFKKEIGTVHFIFEKVELKNREIVFFITSDMPNERSFFMSKMQDSGWKILYTAIIGKEVLRLEEALAAALTENGY